MTGALIALILTIAIVGLVLFFKRNKGDESIIEDIPLELEENENDYNILEREDDKNSDEYFTDRKNSSQSIKGDILENIDIDLCVEYIARLLLYSEGYTDEKPEPPISEKDSLFEEAARLIVIHQQGSTSLVQRKFAIGYNRAGRIMDQLEQAGIVSQTQGSKPRHVLISDELILEKALDKFNANCLSEAVINAVEEKYYDKIQNRKELMIQIIESEKKLEELQRLDAEKEEIRQKLLEKRAKKRN